MSAGVGVHGSDAQPSAAPTVTLTFSAGSTVLAFVETLTGEFSGTPVTSSPSLTWTQVSTEQQFSGAGVASRCYKVENVGAGSYTVTLNTTFPRGLMMVQEVTGAVSSSAVDVAVKQSDAASPFTSPTATTAQADEVLVGFMCDDTSTGTATHTWGGVFASGDQVEDRTSTTTFTGTMAAKAVSSIQTNVQSSVTCAVSVTDSAVWLVSVKGAGGGSPALFESEWHPMEPQTNPLTVSVW